MVLKVNNSPRVSRIRHMEKINPRVPNMEVALNNEVDRITVNW